MAKTEFRLTSLPTEPDASERPTRPVLEMKSVLEKSHAAEPRHEQGAQEFSPQNLKAFENRASVVSRVLARSLDSHRAGASSNEVGKELRSAKELHGGDCRDPSDVKIARARKPQNRHGRCRCIAQAPHLLTTWQTFLLMRLEVFTGDEK